jgi:hypothetical protein
MRLILAAVLVPSLALATPKGHQMNETKGVGTAPTTKTASVCGIKILPLAVGNTWTYKNVPSPTPPDDQIKRIAPPQPNQIVITVKSVNAQKGADTVVTLEEKTTIDLTKDPKKPVLDERTITTTITCNGKTKFEIAPDSFWFAGEPGGTTNLKLDSVEHPKGTSWQLTNGGIGDAEWREDLTAKWTRVPTPGSDAKLGSGKIELERRFTPQTPETVKTTLGTYNSEKLGLITTGRVTLDGAAADTKPMELPANWVSVLWIAEGAGVVQTSNAYAHMYQLTDVKLK